MSYYIPQQDDIHVEIDALDPEQELDFDFEPLPEGDAYRFSSTLTLEDRDA